MGRTKTAVRSDFSRRIGSRRTLPCSVVHFVERSGLGLCWLVLDSSMDFNYSLVWVLYITRQFVRAIMFRTSRIIGGIDPFLGSCSKAVQFSRFCCFGCDPQSSC